MYQFKTVEDNLLIEFDTGDERGEKVTEGGIILKAETEASVIIGTVVEVGPGKLSITGVRTDCLTKRGDEVYFNRGVARSITLRNKKYYVVSESNLLGFVTEVEASIK